MPHPLSLSLSLPVREDPFDDVAARVFFENLPFENAQREQIMQRHGIGFSDIVCLLEYLGADCPGSISSVPVGTGPAKTPGNLEQDYDPLDAEDLGRIMASLRDRCRVLDDTQDPSPLAGVQGKIALAWLPNGRFALPKPRLNVPAKHILKVPRPGEMSSVDQEHLLMAEFQPHPVAETAVLGEGDPHGRLVTRFDRVIGGAMVRCLHQEAFAQALGLGPHLKYERNGTPSRRYTAASVGTVLAQGALPGRARWSWVPRSRNATWSIRTGPERRVMHRWPKAHLE